MPGIARLSAGLSDGIGFFRTIKKPACGRLLGGGFGLFLVSRTRLQSGHPARCGWVWGVTAFCGLALHSGSLEARGMRKCGKSYWD